MNLDPQFEFHPNISELQKYMTPEHFQLLLSETLNNLASEYPDQFKHSLNKAAGKCNLQLPQSHQVFNNKVYYFPSFPKLNPIRFVDTTIIPTHPTLI